MTGCSSGNEAYTGQALSIGDNGPGGGHVFYVSAEKFTSVGSDCGVNCRYLEFAPQEIGNSYDEGYEWCSENNVLLGTTREIGSGMNNTIIANKVCTSGAIKIAADYSNNGKSDWFLPSADEAELLGYELDFREVLGWSYWTSSETYEGYANCFDYSGHFCSRGFPKDRGIAVLPIRAF